MLIRHTLTHWDLSLFAQHWAAVFVDFFSQLSYFLAKCTSWISEGRWGKKKERKKNGLPWCLLSWFSVVVCLCLDTFNWGYIFFWMDLLDNWDISLPYLPTLGGVPIVTEQKGIWLVPWGCSFNPWPWSMGQGSGVPMSWGVGPRWCLDPVLLWLWCRLASISPIGT